MKTPIFKTAKRQRLTRYALACGYIERAESEFLRLDLWQECPGNSGIHVEAYDFFEGKRLFWEVFTSLLEARRFFDKKKQELKLAEDKQ